MAGLAAGALTGAGLLTMTGTAQSRRSKPPLRRKDIKWDAEVRLENWQHIMKAVQQGVSVIPLCVYIHAPRAARCQPLDWCCWGASACAGSL